LAVLLRDRRPPPIWMMKELWVCQLRGLEKGVRGELHDVKAYEYYAHFRALDSHEFIFGEVECHHAAEEHIIECIYCRLLEV
jgi:hypothetical protein